MTTIPDFPVLYSPAKCARLWPKYPEKVVGMFATATPRQNVDVLWRLRAELLKLGVPVVFFFNESAKPMLAEVLAAESPAAQAPLDIYQLDNALFFPLLSFVDVLITNDSYIAARCARLIRAKLISLPHQANQKNPIYWNYFYDYVVSEKQQLNKFDYSYYLNRGKIHRNSSFTQLVAGYPKIDLLLEERQKNTCDSTLPILLIYPYSYIDHSMWFQNIGPEKYVEMWSEVISAFFAWRPHGIVVFRPGTRGWRHPLVERLNAKFMESGHFFLDEDDDNKFWLSRAKYFVTDYSEGFVNFCMTARRPAIRMIHGGEGEEPERDEWGWIIRRPGQVIPLLEQMDTDEERWTAAFKEKQKREMPTLGRNFAILAGMIKRILHNDDDPMWLKLDKGHTPCETSTDILKLVTKWAKQSPYNLVCLSYWLDNELFPLVGMQSTNIYLPLLRRALLPSFETDRPEDRDLPDVVASHVNQWLANALDGLPFKQSVGLIRHLLRKYPEKSAQALLIAATSFHLPGPRKKRALFFLLMEWDQYDPSVLQAVNVLANKLPQHFSRPVLDKLNRVLPHIMKIPLSVRRQGARVLGLKKTLARKYWQAHRALS